MSTESMLDEIDTRLAGIETEVANIDRELEIGIPALVRAQLLAAIFTSHPELSDEALQAKLESLLAIVYLEKE